MMGCIALRCTGFAVRCHGCTEGVASTRHCFCFEDANDSVSEVPYNLLFERFFEGNALLFGNIWFL
jgi:hypothetical protein